MSKNKKLFLMRNEGELALNEIRSCLKPGLIQESELWKEIWKKYILDLIIIIENILEVECVVHTLDDLEKKKSRLISNPDIITLDSYSKIDFSVKLGISRIFSIGGKEQIEIGNRPGYKSLLKQINDIPKNRNYTLVDDDTFTGGTLKFITEFLSEQGLKVTEIVVGCQVGELGDIRVPIKSVYSYKSTQVYDLNDPRDFLMGSYEAGLVVKSDGDLYRVPYIYPLIDINLRSGIPIPLMKVFSNYILSLNKRIFGEMSMVAGELVRVKHTGSFFANYVQKILGFDKETPVTQLCMLLKKNI